MDPKDIFKPKDVNARSGSPSSWSSVRPAGDGIFSSTDSADECTYSSFFRTSCVNGECKEELKRYRSCPGRPKEVAVVNPATKEERWVEAKEDDAFPSNIAFDALSLPSAMTNLWGEVVPEVERVGSHLQNDPIFGPIFREIFPLPQPQMPSVPTTHRSGRNIPIQDGNSEKDRPFNMRSQAPITHDDNPIDNIANSFQSFTDQIDRLFSVHPRSNIDRSGRHNSLTDDEQSDQSDSESVIPNKWERTWED